MLKVKSKWTDKKFQQYFVEKNPFCFFCGKPTSCGHHIKTKGSHPELRYEESNLVAVCNDDHLRIHGKFRKEMEEYIINNK